MSLTAPGFKSVKVTPADQDLPKVSRGLWIGTEGNITVMFSDGTIAEDMPAQVGLFPFFVKQVRTGSTVPAADNIWTIE